MCKAISPVLVSNFAHFAFQIRPFCILISSSLHSQGYPIGICFVVISLIIIIIMYFQEKKNMKLRAVQNDIIFMLQKQEKGIITLSDNDNSLLLQRR